MRRAPFYVVVLVAQPIGLAAATLAVQVRDTRGQPVADAVVYALPESRDLPPARRTAVMDQRDRTFIPHVLAVQAGTAVQFPNSDDIRHQVYSFSSAKTFQLPLYKGTPSSPIVFDKPGVVSLGCNIHDRMNAYIVVVATPYFAVTGKEGKVVLPPLTGGSYAVRVWYPDMAAEPAPLPVTLGPAERRELTFVTGGRR